MDSSAKHYTTTTGLLDLVDKRIHVTLRDGKKIVGILRSFDQYGSLVVQDAVERIYVSGAYGNIDRGIFIIRGENIVLLGELDEDEEEKLESLDLIQLPIEEVLEIQRIETEGKMKKEKVQIQKLASLGFVFDSGSGQDAF
ncbi:hypothetical protein BB559_000788 [Furculomyces boomerangus]|uniref:U6 snRNA-associated Sm-like protein LSm1 n=2 Tax=Harpellales TaxID=61421 RepID=A0A2T9Z454_9FUNG|nr:hypothetical protein BB559_000788 [Furculomyces boomerangus]PWA02577.1 hypothetical protein BB558_001289 [Smittium angustum]